MSFLQIRGLSKRYGPVSAVADVELAVAAGTRTAIVGPSGCGKTTLLRLIAGFEAPDSGQILFDGSEVANGSACVPAHRRGIGLVAQDGALFPHLTIEDNIGFGIDRGDASRPRRIVELAQTVGLDKAMLKRRPHQISGGQQQRVALARAMARQPRLMLLDEPFSALDTGLRASMRKVVTELLGQSGIATILVTHDQAEALSFADQVAVMQDGRFAQVGSPRDLYLRPSNRVIAEFLGDAIILPAHIGDGFAESPFGRLTVEARGQGRMGQVMLRPEQLAISPVEAAEAASPSSGVLLGQVIETEFAGAISTVVVRVLNRTDAGGTFIGGMPLVLRQSCVEAPETGALVRISIAGSAHILA
ncbi:MAG: ABC transporter ATP-binding protein [Rhizobiaceae bacterium]|nr:ABC transporter ATP-binding protein [Rhizobiaceae bacterium]